MACATNSLPEPDSPLMSTVALDWLSFPMARKTSCIAEDLPMISGMLSLLSLLSLCDEPDSDRACLITSSVLSISKGFAIYSKAPFWNAETAVSRSE